MIQKLYKTSEFAALCGVSKHTLFHYDDIGLLCPHITHDNGYRYYTSDQFNKFGIISVLKKAGTPLKEIKTYLDSQDSHSFVSILNDKLIELKKQSAQIEAMCTVLANTITDLEHHQDVTINTLHFAECEEEYLIVSDAPSAEQYNEHTSISCISEHLQYCWQHNFQTGFHVGEIILESNLNQGIFLENYYCSPVNKHIHSDRLFVKPRGTYALMYHKGDYDTLHETYEKMKKLLDEQGYRIIGNLYEIDVIDYLSERNPDNYVLKIAIQVEGIV